MCARVFLFFFLPATPIKSTIFFSSRIIFTRACRGKRKRDGGFKDFRHDTQKFARNGGLGFARAILSLYCFRLVAETRDLRRSAAVLAWLTSARWVEGVGESLSLSLASQRRAASTPDISTLYLRPTNGGCVGLEIPSRPACIIDASVSD